MFYRFFSLLPCLVLGACANQQSACEEAMIAAEQQQQCTTLQKQIVKAKGKPILRTELERRYQTDCVEMRYYRDDHESKICGDKTSEK